MPSAKKKTKPVQPVAPTQPKPEPTPIPAPADNNGNGLPVVYDGLSITEYSVSSAQGPLTVEDMVGLLGWETEKEFKARKLKENPTSKPEQWTFGDIFHCKNLAGEKVRCNYNANNRPFDMSWCEDLIHTILYGQWAGPFTLPGETINGETIRISRHGRVLSGQHQMTAAILADEWLHKAREQLGVTGADARYPVWSMTRPAVNGHNTNHVFLETIVVTGMSEDSRVLMTVDYVKPRSAADVFYTSEVFKSSTPPERKELCRILATATDFLWGRTGTRGYKTHPELVAFLERHKRLLQCVLHLYTENSAAGGRRISKMRLQPGTCAALMYLQGCGTEKTTQYSDEYRNESPPSEKNLDWGYWDRAEEFWTLLGSSPDFMMVRTALARLMDSTPQDENNPGLGGRGLEKLAILSKAWERWKDHPSDAGAPFDTADLEPPDGALVLAYSNIDDNGNRLPDGAVKLLDVADFMGIDCPEIGKVSKNTPPDPAPPTHEEMEEAIANAHRRRQEQEAK